MRHTGVLIGNLESIPVEPHEPGRKWWLWFGKNMPVELLETKPPTAKTKTTTTKTTTTTNDDDHNNNNNNNNSHSHSHSHDDDHNNNNIIIIIHEKLYPFCLATCVPFLLPMFCESRMNRTSVEFYPWFHRVETDAKNKLRRMHLPQRRVRAGNGKVQWSLYAHAFPMSTFNEKSQDHMKCPLQCAEQPSTCRTHWDRGGPVWQGKARDFYSNTEYPFRCKRNETTKVHSSARSNS